MSVNTANFQSIKNHLDQQEVTLVAVSKTQLPEDILSLYQLGQRDFGENYVQELLEKHDRLPGDIRWHFIGHLQTNKVKNIASFITLIQAVDSTKLLVEIDRQAKKYNRTVDCLLQVHIAREETKFGFDERELKEIFPMLRGSGEDKKSLNNVRICGLMGMATFTEDQEKIRGEFRSLKSLFNQFSKLAGGESLKILSMGMSDDYQIALEEGSNMVRLGSLLFGKRTYPRR